MPGNDSKSASSDEILATEFVSERLKSFEKLALPVKKSVLEIVQFYLGQHYFMNPEAALICDKIQELKPGKDEVGLRECYRAYLMFIPLRFRSGIQGEYLFRQPQTADIAAQYYVNQLNEIMKANEEVFGINEFGLTQADHLRVEMLDLERAINDDNKSEGNQPTI